VDLDSQGCVVLIRPTDADVVASASGQQVSKQASSICRGVKRPSFRVQV
jgi:hypothetical protein